MPAGQRPAHLLQLRPGGHLLGEQGGLDAVEQALQPAHQLRGATRSPASLGGSPLVSVNGSDSRSSSSTSSGARLSSEAP